TIANSNLSSNYYGSYLYSSTNNTIINTNFGRNSYGIYAETSANNTLLYNWILNNTNYGIYLSSSTGNYIHHNNLIGNRGTSTVSLKGVSGSSQAYDNSPGNYWYLNALQEGNYWSNWDGQGWGTQNAYPIDGGIAGDFYPIPIPGMHAPIHITSNAEFTPANGVTGGSGTYRDPYIIANWTINAKGGSYCIWIENTSLYFTIRNCNVYNATGSNGPNGAGIAFNNVTNGKIESCSSNNSRYGLLLDGFSQFNTITSNNLSRNTQTGILLSSSSNNTLTNNKISTNPIGVQLNFSSNNTIINNNVSENGRGISLFYSNDNSITHNNASRNDEYGIYLEKSSYNLLSNNTVTGSKAYASIALYYSTSNNITSNNASYSGYGIYLYRSTNNNITFNWILENTLYGIYITSSSTANYIYHNYFIRNGGNPFTSIKGVLGKSQAYDDVGGNYWHNNTLQEGNYWSNWDGQDWGKPEAYPIDGGMASDWYPIGSPVSEFSRFSVVALIVLWLFVLHIGVRKRQK
ncbi:MAG: NosD domain-containing protein, partial [Thermoplasmata archaeon]